MIGSKSYGVRTIEDLKDRCTVDELTDCWVWRFGCSMDGIPSIWSPLRKTRTSVGGIFSDLLGDPGKGKVWYASCGNKMCCNPSHRKRGTRSTQMKAHGIKRSPLVKAKITATKRAQGKLSDEDVRDIVNGGMTLKQISEKYGICVSYACSVRSGQVRAPLSAPSSSVFSWRPT